MAFIRNFFSDMGKLIRGFEDAFCYTCDFFRYDEGYIATGARKIYNGLTYIPDQAANLINLGCSLAVNIPGALIYGEEWDTHKGNACDYIEDKIYETNKKLNSWGVNTRFAGEVINTAFIVTPSLRDGFKSTYEIIYADEIFRKEYHQIQRKQKAFERLEKTKQNEIKSKMTPKQQEIYQRELDTINRRRKTEHWNHLVKDLNKNHPNSRLGVAYRQFKDALSNFGAHAKSQFLNIFSESLALESKLEHENYLKLKELVRKDNQDMWILIDEEFNAIMNGTIDEYNKRFEGLSYDDHLKLAYEAIKTPAPLEDGPVGNVYQQIKGLAANRNHYNLAIQAILRDEFNH